VSVLCLLERDGAGVADVSLRALTLARDLAAPAGDSLAAVFIGGEAPAGALPVLSAFGAAEVLAVSGDGLTGYAPLGWARILAQLAGSAGATAVLAAATDRGSEVMAHLGAITGLPVAANCVSAQGDPQAGAGAIRLIRQRWAGSVLEDAVLEASPALLTVAADAVPARPSPEPGQARVQVITAELQDGDLDVHAAESAERGSGVSLATARVVVGGGRGVGGPEGFGALEACSAARWASPGWSPARAGGRTGSRSARPVPGSRPSSTWPAASAARSSTWQAARAPGTSSRSTPTRTRRSFPAPTTP